VLTDGVSDHLIDADDFGRYVDLRGPARRERALQRRSDSGAARGAAEGEASPPQEPLVRGGRARRAPDPARAGAPGRAAGADTPRPLVAFAEVKVRFAGEHSPPGAACSPRMRPGGVTRRWQAPRVTAHHSSRRIHGHRKNPCYRRRDPHHRGRPLNPHRTPAGPVRRHGGHGSPGATNHRKLGAGLPSPPRCLACGRSLASGEYAGRRD
jgi:hypothetical protein